MSDAEQTSDLKELRERLARCERRFLQFFHSTTDAMMVVVKHNLSIAVVNAAFSDSTGLTTSSEVSAANAPTHDWRPYIDKRDHAAFERLMSDNLAGNDLGTSMVRLRHASSGDVIPCSMHCHRVTQANTFALAFRDMREKLEAEQRLAKYARELEERNQQLRETQAQLVQQGKMAALGSLVAGVAHDINTPLGSIKANAELADTLVARVRAKAAPNDPKLSRSFDALAEATGTISQASRRIGDIVGSLRSFARLDEAEIQRANVHEGIDSAIQLVGHLLEGRIELKRDYGALPSIHCRPGDLNQLFMNLLTNAVQAIEARGTIVVRTRHEGDEIHIAIEDDGAGIAQDKLGRLFDPGFTTKGVGVGTGLGLSIAYRIAVSHAGRLEVASELARGSTFTVILPVDGPKA